MPIVPNRLRLFQLCSISAGMPNRIAEDLAEQLRDKALLALEDAVVECRYRAPRRSFAIRFALAYLWVYGGGRDREPYDLLWRDLGSNKSPWSHSVVDGDLGWIYRALGIDRPEEISSVLWRQWTKQEGNGGGGDGDRR